MELKQYDLCDHVYANDGKYTKFDEKHNFLNCCSINNYSGENLSNYEFWFVNRCSSEVKKVWKNKNNLTIKYFNVKLNIYRKFRNHMTFFLFLICSCNGYSLNFVMLIFLTEGNLTAQVPSKLDVLC